MAELHIDRVELGDRRVQPLRRLLRADEFAGQDASVLGLALVGELLELGLGLTLAIVHLADFALEPALLLAQLSLPFLDALLGLGV